MSNRNYINYAAEEAYNKGLEKGMSLQNVKYNQIMQFLLEHKDKNNYISKKIKKLLEELK